MRLMAQPCMLWETVILWTEALTRKLVGSMHIAAPVINCCIAYER